jgi:hypothetical protein
MALDSHTGMLHLFAHKAYDRLSSQDKRYIDYDDVYQEIAIQGISSLEKYEEGHGTKESTWLYRGLDTRVNEVSAKGKRQKRLATSIVEISDPETLRQNPIPDNRASISHLTEAVDAFCVLILESDAKLRVALVNTVIGHSQPSAYPEVWKTVRKKCTALHIKPEDLTAVYRNDSARSEIVARLAKKDSTKKLKLTCQGCNRCYTLESVEQGVFRVENMTCQDCLNQRKVSGSDCFGTDYSEATLECSQLCPDRALCIKEVKNLSNKETIMTTAIEELTDAEIESQLNAAESTDAPTETVEVSTPVSTPKASKSKPAAKATKATKAVAAKPLPTPKAAKPKVKAEKPVPEAPFRAGSTMLVLFTALKSGLSHADFASLVAERGKAVPQNTIAT